MPVVTPIFPGPLNRVAPAGRWIEIVYAASLIHDTARPALLIRTRSGALSRHALPAPVLGRAIWIGRIPPDAAQIDIEYPAPLRAERVAVRGPVWRLTRAVRRHPRHAAAALALALLGRFERAHRRVIRALTEKPLARYAQWAKPRRREHEPQDLDRPDPAHAEIRNQIEVTLGPGETLTPWALDAVAAAFAADPAVAAVQGASEMHTSGGLTAGFVSAWTPARGPVFHRRGSPAAAARHLRAVLTRHTPRPAPPAPLADTPKDWPSVCVVIPTRDRLDLLRVCIAGVLNGTDYPDLSLTIADNDSAEPATRAYLASLPAQDTRARVVPCPGAFNFSAICNAAAAASSGDVLVFLNNDIEITDPGWLKSLVGLALGPDAGAVGPTLLYPNRRIQHAGVAIGPGGTAGHILRGKPLAALDGIPGPRRIAAVTGACLAIRRDRFDAIGGFDPAFPVIYNDIDLCLRLAARGWEALWACHIRLVHHESASRRATHPDLPAIALFRERWAAMIADDPHYHPAFSDAALDLTLA